MAASSYTASDIEVLSGLDPVRRRPGMYTDTTRPNHLAHEVIDNSVDEALAGFCQNINVTVYKDGSLQVEDDGRGMPVDIHPKEKISGVELILTRLHAGGKFNDKTYQHAGGLHGVGVSVVNALSKHLECWVRRGGKEYNVSFAGGRLKSKLEVVGDVQEGTEIEATFDEFNLDVRVRYTGAPLIIPERKPTPREIIASEEGERLLAGYLLSQSADRINCRPYGNMTEVQLHYDH